MIDEAGAVSFGAGAWLTLSMVCEPGLACGVTPPGEIYATKFVSEVAAHEARHGGERGSTRCELQKPAAGRVYGVPRLSR
jgi:hypothetical protein